MLRSILRERTKVHLGDLEAVCLQCSQDFYRNQNRGLAVSGRYILKGESRMAQAWGQWGIPEFSTRFLSFSLSLIFNFCSATKPHLSFFLKIMFNFLSLQHYTPCVIGVGWGKSPKVAGSHCFLLEEEQSTAFTQCNVVRLFPAAQNRAAYVLWL